MAKVRNENEMATNVVDSDEPDNDEEDSKSPVPYIKPSKGSVNTTGFFTIYKKGQGKWTRLGTIFTAGALGILTAYSLYDTLQSMSFVSEASNARAAHQALLGVCILFLIAFGAVTYWLTNKPNNVDFLIATDSEMKKVNWTTQGELYGSTRVVVLFLFFIAIFLSVVDLVFYELFHFIGVLQ